MDTTTFAIKPDLVFSLSGGGIRKTGTWTVYQNGLPMPGAKRIRSLTGAKKIVRDSIPDGTPLEWRRNEYNEWSTTVQVHHA